MYIWTLEDIIRYLDSREGTIIVRDGIAHVQFPGTPDRERFIREIWPHLKAKKVEILEWFANLIREPHPLFRHRPELFAESCDKTPRTPDFFEGKTDADRDFDADLFSLNKIEKPLDPVTERYKILSDLRQIAIATNKPVYLLLRKHGTIIVMKGESTRKKRRAKMYDASGKSIPKLATLIPIPPERSATHAIVPGMKQWVPLPKVTTHDEDIRLEPPKRRKQSKGD